MARKLKEVGKICITSNRFWFFHCLIKIFVDRNTERDIAVMWVWFVEIVYCSLFALIWIGTTPTDDSVHRTMCMSSLVVIKLHWKQEWNGFSRVSPYTVSEPEMEKVVALFRCCFCYSWVTTEKVIQRQNSGFLCSWIQTECGWAESNWSIAKRSLFEPFLS